MSVGAKPAGIFISYRREDTQGYVGHLFADLKRAFGANNVFMDVAGIEFGRDFRQVLDDNVARCGVLLAVIGPHWMSDRLNDANDFVRLEIAAALVRGIPVVPVLVQGARLPDKNLLPEDLRDLVFRHAIVLTHEKWDSDIELLVQALKRQVPQSRGRLVQGSTLALIAVAVLAFYLFGQFHVIKPPAPEPHPGPLVTSAPGPAPSQSELANAVVPQSSARNAPSPAVINARPNSAMPLKPEPMPKPELSKPAVDLGPVETFPDNHPKPARQLCPNGVLLLCSNFADVKDSNLVCVNSSIADKFSDSFRFSGDDKGGECVHHSQEETTDDICGKSGYLCGYQSGYGYADVYTVNGVRMDLSGVHGAYQYYRDLTDISSVPALSSALRSWVASLPRDEGKDFATEYEAGKSQGIADDAAGARVRSKPYEQ